MKPRRHWLAVHKWWLAMAAVLFTPWIGPHVDRYVPLGWVLVGALRESPDTAFWIVGTLLLLLGYGLWLVILGAIAAWQESRRQP